MRDIDTRLPLDLPDEKMGFEGDSVQQESEMTSLLCRIRIAQLAETISDEAFGCVASSTVSKSPSSHPRPPHSLEPVAYSRILELDRQVNDLEADMPAIYRDDASVGAEPRKDPLRALRIFMIQLAFCQERLRLHRPYQTRSAVDETFVYSRDVCLETARQILRIHASPLCVAPWAGLNYKVSS